MIQTLIFDFGNVIGFFDHRLAIKNLAAHSDLGEDALHALLFGCSLEDDYEQGRLSTAEFIRMIRARCGFRCSDEELGIAYADMFWPNAALCALVPRLKGRYRLVLGSNTSELHSRWFRRQYADTLGHFDGQVLSHEVGVRKPKAEFFQHCLRLAGCPPHHCVFIDDLPANVAGAQACGLHAIVYKGFDDLCRQMTDMGVSIEAQRAGDGLLSHERT
jgi:putative hydrolase of the HAD superfamily